MSFIGEINKAFKSEGFIRYLKNTSWLFWGKIIQMGMTFLVTAAVARYLDDTGFGLLNYANSVGTFFVMFAALGLQSIVIRNLVEGKEAERDKIVGTALMMRLVASTVGIAGFLLIASFLPHTYQENVLVFLVILATLFQAFDIFDYYFQSKVISHYTVKVRLFAVLLMVIMQLVLIQIEAGLVWFGVALLLRNVVVGIGLGVVYGWKFGNFRDLSIDKSYATHLLKDAWPLIFSDLVVILYMTTDKIMLKFLMGAEGDASVGQYSAALKFSEVWYFIGPVLTGSLFPAIVNAKKKGNALYHSRLQNYYNLMVWVALAITIPMVTLGPWILTQDFLFSDKYADAGPVLVIHIWTLVFVFLGLASSKHLIAENQQRMELNRTMIGAAVNIALNFYLIPRYGIRGAAFATLISQAIASYLAYLLFPKYWYVFRMQTRALLLIDVFKKLVGK